MKKTFFYILLAMSLLTTQAFCEAPTLDELGYLTITTPGAMKNYTNTEHSPYTDASADINFVTLTTGVTAVGNSAFTGCTKLADAVMSSDVTQIGTQAFADCTNLKKIVIPYGVTSIKSYAFANCTSLEEIIIPDSVTMIGESAFWNCGNLTIYGGTNSIANSCATARSIPFVSIDGSQNNRMYVSFDTSILINGTPLSYNYPVIMKNDMTLIPLRTIFEAIGATVSWDNETKSISVSNNNHSAQFSIDQLNSVIDGNATPLEIAPQLINGKTMIHVRAVSLLGASVNWDGEANTISITY